MIVMLANNGKQTAHGTYLDLFRPQSEGSLPMYNDTEKCIKIGWYPGRPCTLNSPCTYSALDS